MPDVNERAKPAREESVADRVRRIVKDQLGIVDAGPHPTLKDPSFRDDLGADSLEMVEIVMAIEAEFDIDIDSTSSDAWRTVGDAIAYVEAAVVARADR